MTATDARPLWRQPVLIAIFLLCLLPELVLAGADWGLWGNPRWRLWAIRSAGFWAGLLHGWQPNYAAQPWAMFVTYGFLHAGTVHFAVNMLTLFSLGGPLAERLGPMRFVVLYTLSDIGGAAGYALLSSHLQPMVGASGALFGLAGAVVALGWRTIRASGGSLWPVGRAVAGLAALNLVLWWAMNGQLAWETHLGGFIAGWIAALWLDRPARAADLP